MKLTIQHRNVRSTDKLNRSIEEKVLALHPRVQIDEASVLLEQDEELSPPYTVKLHLVTPGPDIFADGQDYTIQAAIKKMMESVDSELARRSRKRERRLQSQFNTQAGRLGLAY